MSCTASPQVGRNLTPGSRAGRKACGISVHGGFKSLECKALSNLIPGLAPLRAGAGTETLPGGPGPPGQLRFCGSMQSQGDGLGQRQVMVLLVWFISLPREQSCPGQSSTSPCAGLGDGMGTYTNSCRGGEQFLLLPHCPQRLFQCFSLHSCGFPERPSTALAVCFCQLLIVLGNGAAWKLWVVTSLHAQLTHRKEVSQGEHHCQEEPMCYKSLLASRASFMGSLVRVFFGQRTAEPAAA